MGNVIPMPAGGGGADLDAVTATEHDVLEGKVIVDKDGDPVTGTMPDNPAISVTLSAGESTQIPEGHVPGGTVAARDLASQTPGNASAGSILQDESAWVNGQQIVGNMPAQGVGQHAISSGINEQGLFYYFPQGHYPDDGSGNCWVYRTVQEIIDTLGIASITSFSVAQYSSLVITAYWANPTSGVWSGVVIKCKQDGYPANADDGTTFYEGNGTWANQALAAGVWYFRAFNYINTNRGRFYGPTADAPPVNNEVVQGQQIFTSSDTFTVPNGVREVEVFCVGGGGCGGSNIHSCCGGGGGGYTTTNKVTVTPNQQIAITIGGGGAASTSSATNSGGQTSFGTFVVANGGTCNTANGGNGGSGGGAGEVDAITAPSGNGGSNGSDGGAGSKHRSGGVGQHTTTGEFGDSSATRYGGGGGGASITAGYGSFGRDGGGNGSKCLGRYPPEAGTPNTGGGGGGAQYKGKDSSRWDSFTTGAAGGSGICIVRWGY